MILHGDVKIMAAFVKARGEIGATVKKDGQGNYGKYATLAALTEATVESMAKYGLAIVQEASVDEAGATVETWVVHELGGIIQFAPLTLPVAARNAQAVGSAITYARRYALAAICGIAPDDDDGQAATDNAPKAQERTQSYQARNTTRAAAAPRTAPQEPPSEAPGVDGDELFMADAKRGTITDATKKRLHSLGVKYYGSKDEWDIKRPGIVEAITTGASKSSADLLEAEAKRLCASLEAKLAQLQQPDAQPAANGAAA